MKENRNGRTPFCGDAKVGRISALSLWTLFVTLGVLYAQEFTGFRGRVTDPSGAIAVGAKITATDEKTGLSVSTISNEAGEYELRGVRPGTFKLEAELTGFKKYQNTGVIVYARNVRRVDIKLDLGEIAETITVQEQGAVLETDSSKVIYKAPQKEVYALNIQGSMIGFKGANPGSEYFSQVHGNHANNTVGEMDGIANDGYGLFRAPQESIKEINYTSLNAPAEYRTSANINGVGTSGTNQFHAEYFINLAHDRFNALSAGATARPRVQRPTVFHELILSGPVVIPKVYDGRNKTFAFFMYQPLSIRSSVNQVGYIAPTALMRQGNFSEWTAATGRTLRDPLTGQPFPGNVIPRERFGPVWNRILAIGEGPGGVPMPNIPGAGLVRNYQFVSTTSGDESWFHYRFDHQITPSNRISVTHMRNTRFQVGNARNIPQDGGVLTESDTRALSIQDTHIFSPRLLNEFMFSINRQAECAPCGFGYKNAQARVLNDYKINLGSRLPPATYGSPHFNTQTVGAGVTFDLLGAEISGVMDFPEKQWQVRDNLSYQKGKHLFKTGFELRQHRSETFVVGGAANVGGDAWGRYTFTGVFSGNDFADVILGLPEQTSISTTRSRIFGREWEFGTYFQDDWKITPTLTLTPGIRFQHYGAPYEANGLFYNFDVAKQRVVVPDQRGLAAIAKGFPLPVVTAAEAGYPEHLANFKKVLWEPRFGFAWRPSAKTVIRGGYGIYHVPFASASTYAAGYRGDSGARGTDSRGARAGLLNGLEYGPFLFTEAFGPNRIVNGVPLFTLQDPFPGGTAGLQSLYSRPVNGRKDNWPYDQQWNLTIEREFLKTFSFRATYVGSKGTHWPYVRDLQTPPPSSTPFTPSRRPLGPDKIRELFLMDLGGNGTYHGMELELTRQFSSGLYLRGWYDWKKSLNDVLGGRLGDSIGGEIEDPFNRVREKGYQAFLGSGGTPSHAGRIVAVWDVPAGRNKRFLSGAPGWVNHIVGNWSAAPLLTFSGHARFHPEFTGTDVANIGRSSIGPVPLRADIIPGCDPYAGGSLPGFYWNRACFKTPPNGRYGNVSRGMLHGPWVYNVDFNAFKTWFLTGKETGPYLKAEFYSTNFLNHRNTGGPASTLITSGNFGRFNTAGNRGIYFRFRIGF